MTIKEFTKKINELYKQGWIVSLRRGNTGIGHTLEQKIGLTENNIAEPDLGEIELKAKRTNTTNKITMFTFNRAVWKIRQKELIEFYGYVDYEGRTALYCTVTQEPNNQGLYTKINGEESQLELLHTDGTVLAVWEVEYLIGIFNRKMSHLIVVNADSRMREDGKEEFLFNKAYYLEHADENTFVEFLKNGTIVVDIRMHLKESGAVRNHGTGFRIDEAKIENCFRTKRSLIKE